MASVNPRVRVTSDGTPYNTMVYLDGQPQHVTRLTWEVSRHHSKLVLEFDGEPALELEGIMHVTGQNRDPDAEGGGAGRGQELQEDPA